MRRRAARTSARARARAASSSPPHRRRSCAWQVTSGAEVEDVHEQEIFEFPWVVFDVSSKQVVDDKTVYVKPTLHEELGVECAKAALGDDAEASMDGAGTLQQAVQVCPRPARARGAVGPARVRTASPC